MSVADGTRELGLGTVGSRAWSSQLMAPSTKLALLMSSFLSPHSYPWTIPVGRSRGHF